MEDKRKRAHHEYKGVKEFRVAKSKRINCADCQAEIDKTWHVDFISISRCAKCHFRNN